MGKKVKNEFLPDYVSPPGDTLRETIESIGMTQAELAARSGRPVKTINEIIRGKAQIIPETAIQLEKVLGIPASFWNLRQSRYDEYIARKNEQEHLTREIEWTRNFPYSIMTKLDWLPETRNAIERLNHILKFFGVVSPEAWDRYWCSIQVRYRKSSTSGSDQYALAAWLRKGELLSNQLRCEAFNKASFNSILFQIRKLTTESPEMFRNKIIDMCASAGVAVVFVPYLPKTASGATRWISTEKALIQLSFKYGTDDHFWFSFFHEAGHILKHSKSAIFIEKTAYSSQQEDEADTFAAEQLIPKKEYENLAAVTEWNEPLIRSFASRLGVSPGIVVGRLQHDGCVGYHEYNNLKQKLVWV